MQALKITREPECDGRISPFQSGDFIEYWCNCVPSMWAEKLYDGGFEGLSPYKHPFIAQTDFQEKPWYPSGQVNRAQYTFDPEDPVSGDFAQRIATQGDTPCTVGLSQDGIAVEASEAYRFSCYLRCAGGAPLVRVRLHKEGNELAAAEFRPTGEWTKFKAEFSPVATETDATLSFSFRGPATVWIDSASLMPRDTVGGWRRDVVEAVRQLKPAMIRFGGNLVEVSPSSADDRDGKFRWQDSIGAPDRRRPFRAVGGLQPTGPGIEEIVQFIQAVGAEPLLCVKSRHTSPGEAADEVEYFNGAADTAMGKRRAANGHPAPYGIKYWQVGNEQYGRLYEEVLPELCRRMKQADPSIKLLASYPSPAVLRGAGEWLDCVCPHYYGCENIPGVEKDLERIRALCREHAPHRPIRVGVTEWNTTAGDWGLGRAKLWTLDNALRVARFRNLMHRHSDFVAIANRSNLPNAFCSGLIQTDTHRLFKTPAYYAQQLYNTLAGDRPLRVDSAGTPDTYADVSASESVDQRRVVVFLVNLALSDEARQLDFTAFGEGGRRVRVWTLSDRDQAGEPDVANSFADPERVRVRESSFTVAAPQFDYVLPALSLTALEWAVVREP